jgi:hypothetical protein
MKMKTKIYFIAVLTSLLIFMTACNDDEFLEETPSTFYTIENSFNTLSQVEASVTNMYLHIRYWFQFNYLMKGSGADLLDVPFWRGSGNGNSNFSLWSPDYQPVEDIWNAFYMLVSYANQTLEGVEVGNITWTDEEERNYVIAQAKFFRGFAYMTLGELFGGVPLVDQLYTSPKYDFVRSTREETYLFAIRDLEDALNGMPDYPQEAGRVAKGATYHYLAETYLALATELGNDKAYLDASIENATRAMELHSLMTSRFGSRAAQGGGPNVNGIPAYYEDGNVFFDLFQRGNLDYEEGNTEALWTLQNDYDAYLAYPDDKNNNDNYLNYPRYLSPVPRDANWNATYREDNSSPWPEKIDAYVGGRGVSFYAPTDYVQNVVWEGDYWDDMRNSPVNIRRVLVCTDTASSYYGDTVTLDMLDQTTLERLYPIWTKFTPIDDWGYEDLANGGNRDAQLRTFIYQDDYACRLAETYLIRAEAHWHNGNTADAAADINVLRSRAQCSHLVTGAEVSLDLILAERVRELFVEERRWCTLLRMGGTVAIDQISRYSYFAGSENTYYLGPSAVPSGWNLWPIPQTIIQANLDAVLEQNPGWE